MNRQQSITIEGAGYEQAILQIMHSLPVERMAQLLDFALFLKMQPTAITPPAITKEAGLLDEQLWNQASLRSLAKYWDTPEEDEAWEHLHVGEANDDRYRIRTMVATTPASRQW